MQNTKEDGKRMRYEIKNETVIFYLENPKRANEFIRTQSFAGTPLSEQQIIPLIDCLVRKLRGMALGSQNKLTTIFLRPLFSYFQKTGSAWPITSADWQLTVYHFYQFYLVDASWSQARTATRMTQWQTHIGNMLEFLKDEEIIPRDVEIPAVSKRRIQSHAKSQPLLGQQTTFSKDIQTAPQKLLVDINFGMADADYLDTIEKKCRHLVGIIKDLCLSHWNGLMKDAETGQHLAAQVTDAEIDEAIAAGRYEVRHSSSGLSIKLASPTHSLGHNWLLAIIRRALKDGKDIGCVSVDALRTSPFAPISLLRSNKSNHSYLALGALTAMAQEHWEELPHRAQLYRFAGLLSNLDAAAACCLLTIEHPEFTSESLQNARLLDVRGKNYLLLTDSTENSILTLDKPRAGKRKSVVLTDLSQKLLLDIIRQTAPAREVLRRAGDKAWRYLFLGVRTADRAHGFLGVLEGKPRYLAGEKNSIGLATLYPKFSQNGLTKGTFDFRRLRNTLGVIRWFETGSIVEMSRRLGNTRKVALEHYLPPALLHAWNTRIIRRFQNTLIVLAAHDEPYLLEVTDFTHMADLQHFVAQLILDYPAKTSPLADEVRKRLHTEQQRKSIPWSTSNSLLNVRLSPNSLGLLYSYSALALKTLTSDELDKIDILSGLAPRQFTDMAALFRHAAENEKIHASLRESLDLPLLKNVHLQAQAIQASLEAQFAKLAIKQGWVEKS